MPQNPTKWAFTCKLRPWHSRGRAFRRFYEWKTLGGTKLQCRGMWTCRANCVETLRDVGFMSVQLRFGIAKQFLTSHKGVAFSVTSCPAECSEQRHFGWGAIFSYSKIRLFAWCRQHRPKFVRDKTFEVLPFNKFEESPRKKKGKDKQKKLSRKQDNTMKKRSFTLLHFLG